MDSSEGIMQGPLRDSGQCPGAGQGGFQPPGPDEAGWGPQKKAGMKARAAGRQSVYCPGELEPRCRDGKAPVGDGEEEKMEQGGDGGQVAKSRAREVKRTAGGERGIV